MQPPSDTSDTTTLFYHDPTVFRKTSPTPRRTSGTHGAAVPVRSAIDAIATYDWPTAEQRIKSEIAAASSPTVKDSLNAALNRVHRAAELMEGTKNLVLLDSISLERAHWLDSLTLSPDAGRLVAGSTLGTGLPHCGTAFVNALGTEAILPAGQPRRLYRVVKAGNRWSQPEPLEGIDSTFADIDFPFVTSDGGITLIFSAHSINSGIGGRDLYITRYNPDTRRFVRPVSLGMPFNSPEDDLCYVLDAGTRQGYLFTTRRQPAGHVCRYTFLFDTPNFEELATDFRSETGRRLAAQWLDLTEQARATARLREEAERRYAQQRNETDAQILRRTELTLSRLHQDLKTLAKAIRQAEQP